MSMGLPAYTSIGSGTLQAAASATPSASPHANTLPGDLVVMVGMAGGQTVDAPPIDAGDGWLVLTYLFQNGTVQDLFWMAALLAVRAGASGYAGLKLQASGDWLAQTHTYRLASPGKFHLAGFGAGVPVFNAASAQALPAPAIQQPYQQVIDLVGRGYWNLGTTTTVGNITNFTERFDTGNTTQGIGVVLNDRTAAITGAVQNASLTSNLAVAKIERFGGRAMIPLIGITATHRGRYGSARRVA